MATDKEKIVLAAKLVIEALKKKDVVIQRYNADSSNSIYLKLDLGVAHSIRFSDHPGKSGLSYRYNLLIQHTGGIVHNRSSEGYDRYVYPLHMAGKMVEEILKERKSRMDKYGPSLYRKYMEDNWYKSKDKPGFWKEAVFIK